MVVESWLIFEGRSEFAARKSPLLHSWGPAWRRPRFFSGFLAGRPWVRMCPRKGALLAHPLADMPPVLLPRAEHCISRKQIDADALKVLYRLNRAGHTAYLVGGGVRDLLLARTPKDYDVSRTILISRPCPEVFKYLKSLKKQDKWSPWAEKDPNMKKSFTGVDGEVGSISF